VTQPIIFTSVEFMSAKEKYAVLRDWEKFIIDICLGKFTQRLYHHLTQHASFIAHYDRFGFYNTYFESPAETAKFFTQFDREKDCRSVEYGNTYWFTDEKYGDLNKAMVDAVEPLLPKIYGRLKVDERAQDLAQAHALLNKHGVPFNF